jgi:hypothetical protein
LKKPYRVANVVELVPEQFALSLGGGNCQMTYFADRFVTTVRGDSMEKRQMKHVVPFLALHFETQQIVAKAI